MATLRPVALFVPELFLYGYVSTYFSGSVWLGPALVLVVWLFFFMPQAPVDVLGTTVFVTVPVGVLIGAVMAAIVTWALALPPLLPRVATILTASTRPKRSAEQTDNDGELVPRSGWRNHAHVFGQLLILGPRFAVWYRETTTSIFGVVFVAGFAIAGLVNFTLYFSGNRALWLDVRYLVYFNLYLLLPWLYSVFVNFRPWEGIALLTGLTLLTFAIVAVEVSTISTRAVASAPLEGDPRYLRTERYWPRIAWRWLVGVWLPLGLVYLGAWIADSLTFDPVTQDGNAATILLTVGVTAVAFAALILCVSLPRGVLSLYSTSRRVASPADAESGDEPQQPTSLVVGQADMTQSRARPATRSQGGIRSGFAVQ